MWGLTRNEKRNGKELYHWQEFSSVAAWVKQAAEGASGMDMRERSSRRDNDNNFCRYSWGETLAAAVGGYDATHKVKELVNGLFAKIKPAESLTDGVVYADDGGMDIDVGAYMGGEPECFLDMRETQGVGKTVELIVDGLASAGVHQDTIERRGAAIMALAESLKMRGYACGVTLVFGSGERFGYNGKDAVRGVLATTVVRVQEPTHATDFDTINFALSHPGSLRRMQFSLMEQWPEEMRKKIGVPGGYGAIVNVGESEIDSDSIYFPPMIGSDEGQAWHTEEGAVRELIRLAAEQGIEIANPYEEAA